MKLKSLIQPFNRKTLIVSNLIRKKSNKYSKQMSLNSKPENRNRKTNALTAAREPNFKIIKF